MKRPEHLRAFCLLVLTLAGTAPGGATAAPHHARTGAAHQALLAAQAAHAAMLKRQADAAQTIAAQQAAQAKAADAAREAALHAQATRSQRDTDRQALAATTQAHRAATQHLAALLAERARLQDSLLAEETRLRAMLPQALRAARNPVASLVLADATPGDTARGLATLSGFAALLQNEAAHIQSQQTALARLNADVSASEQALAARQADQTKTTLAATRAAQTARQDERRDDAALARAKAAAQAAAAEAQSLNAALAHIEDAERTAQAAADAEARAAAAAHDQARARHAAGRARQLAETLSGKAGPGLGAHGGIAPVAGPILTSFGQETEAGPASGITYAASPGSLVQAPCAGVVEFAGPFRSFGQMVILDCGRGLRFVIAGLGTIAPPIGGHVGRGARLGAMASSAENGASGRPILFVQLRQGARSIDPRGFL